MEDAERSVADEWARLQRETIRRLADAVERAERVIVRAGDLVRLAALVKPAEAEEGENTFARLIRDLNEHEAERGPVPD